LFLSDFFSVSPWTVICL